MNRRFLLFAVAFVVALAGTGAVFVYVSEVDARAVADQQPTEVLVAKQQIRAGTTAGSLQESDLVEVKLLALGSVPANALKDVKGLEEQVALSDIYPGEVLLTAKFAAEAAPNSGALSIPEGKLAVSVLLDDPRGVAGFVTPGADVAVFDTFNVGLEEAGGPTPSGDRLNDAYEMNRATRLLLERVTVLAVGPDTRSTDDDVDEEAAEPTTGQPATAVALTLAVSQAQAEKLIHAAETGSLWFALLSKSSATAPTAGVDNGQLFGGDPR